MKSIIILFILIAFAVPMAQSPALKSDKGPDLSAIKVVDDELGGADTWYDSLPAGKYELTLERRLNCCTGPMIDSNTINFEVVP